MPALAVTDHGAMFGALKFYEAAREPPASSRSSAWRPTSRPARASTAPRARARRSTTTSRSSPRTRPATATCCSSCRSRPPRGLLPPAAHGQAAPGRARGGPHLPVRLPVLGDRGRSCSPGSGTGRSRGRRTTATSSAPTGYFVELQDHGLADQRAILRRADRARATRSACRSSPRTTCTTRSAPTRSRTTSCCASSSRSCSRTPSAEVRRRGVLPEERRGDAPGLPRAAGGLRRHAARSPSGSSSTPRARAHPRRGQDRVPPAAIRDARREPLDAYLRELVEVGPSERYGDPDARAVRERIEHELGGHHLRWGSPATS